MKTKEISINSFRRSFASLLMASSLFICASCNNDENAIVGADMENGGDPIEVKLSVGINDFSTDGQSETRSVAETQSFKQPFNDDYDMLVTFEPTAIEPKTRAVSPLNNGVKFRILAYQNSVNTANFKGSADYEIVGGAPNLIAGSLNLSAGNYRFVAYSYNTADNLPVFNGASETLVTGITSGTDFLQASVSQNISSTNTALNIIFNHFCSRVLVRVDASRLAQGNVTQCSANMSGLETSTANWDVASSNLSVQSGTSADLNFSWISPSASIVDSNPNIVMPITGKQLTISFPDLTIGGQNYANKSIVLNNVNLNQGYSYVCTINLLPSSSNLGGGDKNANCYIVLPNQTYTLNALYKGNSLSQGTGSVKGAKLVWQTSKNLITNVSSAGGQIIFTVADVEGNAVVAATDDINGAGKILWSWHIWVTKDKAKIEAGAGLENRWMDRNLGALGYRETDGVKAFGLQYQWGRKDPFTANGDLTANKDVTIYDGENVAYTNFERKAPSTLFTADYANEHPDVFSISGTGLWLAVNDETRWGGDNVNTDGYYLGLNKGYSTKTINDPCPAGWKVPNSGSNEGWGKLYGQIITGQSSYYGQNLPDYGGWYPLCGTRRCNEGSLIYNTTDTYYWAANHWPGARATIGLIVRRGDALTTWTYLWWGYAASVRCVRDIKNN